MKKSLILAVMVALPLMAQDAAPAENKCCPKPDCACADGRPCLPPPAGSRAPKDPRMSPEKQAEFLARWDADKDGQLSDEEKAAAKADWEKKHAERGLKGKCGHREHGPKGKCGQHEHAPEGCECPPPACCLGDAE